jgi:phosphohistidine phosphatase SixA
MKKDHRKLRKRPLFTPLLAPILGAVIVIMLVGLLWTAQGTTTVILVRNAESGVGNNGESRLTDTGVYRARALAGWLGKSGLSRIYVADYPPAESTAGPVAEATGAELVKISADDIDAVLDAVGRLRGENVLIVWERSTLPQIIQGLSGSQVEIGEKDHSGLYIVTDSFLTRARLLELRYGG